MNRKLPRVAFLVSLCLLLHVEGCTPQPPAQSVDETGQAISTEVAAEGSDGSDLQAACSAERSCGRATIVCKRPDEPRPCGAAGCVDMQFACSADADCLEGYRCEPCAAGDPFPCGAVYGKCRPRSCARDRDCGSPNVVCTAGGVCAHKPCRRSSTCRGYCVAGACWNEPGWCHDTTLPPPP